MDYQYLCPSCGSAVISDSRSDTTICPCGVTASRDWTFGYVKPFQEHFNSSVGMYVNNRSQLQDALKVASEEASYRMGLDHSYEYLSPADMAEASNHGVTEEGLDDTRRAQHEVTTQ
jgi:hypothetical protein